MFDGVQTCAVRLVAPTIRTSRMMRRLSSLSTKARQESSESNSMVTITWGVLSIGLRKVRNSSTPGWLSTVGIQSLRALFAYTRRFSRWVGKSHVMMNWTIGLRTLSSASRSPTGLVSRPPGWAARCPRARQRARAGALWRVLVVPVYAAAGPLTSKPAHGIAILLTVLALGGAANAPAPTLAVAS